MKVKLLHDNFSSDYCVNLLRARGVDDLDRFLNPNSSCLQDWFNLSNIEPAINLFKENAFGHICIIVDCDCDGYTSAAIIYSYLAMMNPGLIIDYYIHENKQHGFEDCWEELLNKNYDLIIAPDAASNDSQYIKEFQCPVLVIDHHLTDDTDFSDNMFVVNNQLSPNYHNKFLSGAGMAYQFCRGLDVSFGLNYADRFIDLAALGIDGDVMSGLETENQYFWKTGFAHIQNTFFKELILKQAYSLTGKTDANWNDIVASLNPISVAFYIVPLINAMVRMGTIDEKKRMFMALVHPETLVPSGKRGEKGKMVRVVEESVRECVNAKSHQKKIRDAAVAKLEQKIFKYDLLENQILFIRLDEDDDFPAEMNGLIATQFANTYKHPTIIARLNDEGMIRGSIRGVSNSELISFKDYLESTGLFEYVQGHDNASGCSISNSLLNELHNRANEDLKQYNFNDSYFEADFERWATDSDLKDLIIDINSYKDVWSTNCNEPLIHIVNLYIHPEDLQVMGKNQDTVKIVKNGVAFMKFNAMEFLEELRGIFNYADGVTIELVGRANLNTFRGVTTPQIFIDEYEITEESSLLEF